MILGLEDFETKVERINFGEDRYENFGWIMEIFNKYRNSVSRINENIENVDGLEPPNLVEKWGLKSSVNNNLSNPKGIMKVPEEHHFQMDLIGNSSFLIIGHCNNFLIFSKELAIFRRLTTFLMRKN